MATTMRQKLNRELWSLLWAGLYFGAWLAALLLLKELVLAEYHIRFHHFSMALIGALLLAKVVLILEHVPLGARVRAAPAWVDVALRTALYALGVLLLLILEKVFEERHADGGVRRSIVSIYHQADAHHVLANALCITGALLGYNALAVIRRHLGEGGLLRMFALPLPDEPRRAEPRPARERPQVTVA